MKLPFGKRGKISKEKLVEIGKEIGKKTKRGLQKKKSVKESNNDLLKFVRNKVDKSYMEEIVNNPDVENTTEFTSESLLLHLKNKYGKKKSGKDFVNQDIYQYIYRGNLPKEYGGNKVEVKTKVQGIVLVKLHPETNTYKEKRGRKKLVNLQGID